MFEALEAAAADYPDVDERDDGADGAERRDRPRVFGDDLYIDRGDARDYHHIERESGYAVHLIIVYIPVLHDAFALELVRHELDERRRYDAPDEVEAPGYIVEQLDPGPVRQLREEEHYAEREGVRKRDEGDLYRRLVHRFAVLYLIFGFKIADLTLAAGDPFRYLSLFLEHVYINDAYDGRYDEADRRDSQTEAALSVKAVVSEVYIPRQRVSGSLTVSERQDHAGVIEQTASELEEQKRYGDPDDSLKHIGTARKKPVLHRIKSVFPGLVLFDRLQGHRYKADAERVIRYNLHQTRVDERKAAGFFRYEIGDEEEKPPDQRARDERSAQERYLAPQRVAYEQRDK